MDMNSLILQQLEHLDLQTLYDIAGILEEETGLPLGTSFLSFFETILNGSMTFQWNQFYSVFVQLFLKEIRSGLMSCSTILSICVLSGLFHGIFGSFGSQTVSKVGTLLCSFICGSICIIDFNELYGYCLRQMELMIVTVQSLFPVMIPLILSSGKATAGTILNPLMISTITLIHTMLDRWILPAVFYSCSFCIVGHMADQPFMTKAGKLTKDVIIYVMGITVTVLSALTSLQGIVVKTADSILLKTARYSVDNFIPIIGGFAADSIDMVLSCTIAIKNAIGIWGMLLILVVMITPLVKLAAMILIYRCTSILAEALTSKSMAQCLEDIASAFTTLAVIYTLMGILFIVFLTILINIV